MVNINESGALKVMTDPEFARFGEFIEGQCGIKMPLAKKTMLQGRLQKRLRFLGIESYTAYADYVFSPKGREEELFHMIDAVTTNKTDFFRESKHFDYLRDVVFPELKNNAKNTGWKKLKAWSAGCSTGEEPYTLAMVLSHFAENNPSFHFSILATDISTKVLDLAKTAIYQEEKIEPVPMEFRKKYLMRSPSKPIMRIVPELRSCLSFMRLNFMDTDYRLQEMMDIVFCRNVIIYFDRQTQENILGRICRYLIPGGHLFMGHSETLNGMNLPLRQISSSIYRRQ